MIVEDNHAIARAMEFLLQREGYDTKWCQDDSLYTLVREWRPDLILMDLKMPHLDGSAATLSIKSDPETTSIPIIVVTAENVPQERLMLMKANEMIRKPFQVPKLLERIRYWLTRKNGEGRSPESQTEQAHRESTGREPMSKRSGEMGGAAPAWG